MLHQDPYNRPLTGEAALWLTAAEEPVLNVEVGDLVDPYVTALRVERITQDAGVVHLHGRNATLEVPVSAHIQVAL